MDHDPTPQYPEGEYGVIQIPDAWHVASLGCFIAALGARFVVKLLPGGGPMRSTFAVLVFAALGLVLGLFGLRSPRGRGAARIAVFLNATVLLLGGLAVAAFFYILPK